MAGSVVHSSWYVHRPILTSCLSLALFCSSFSLNHTPLALSVVAWWWTIPTESSPDLWAPFFLWFLSLGIFSVPEGCIWVAETLLGYSGQKTIFCRWKSFPLLSSPSVLVQASALPPGHTSTVQSHLASPLPFALLQPLLSLLPPAGPSKWTSSLPLTENPPWLSTVLRKSRAQIPAQPPLRHPTDSYPSNL